MGCCVWFVAGEVQTNWLAARSRWILLHPSQSRPGAKKRRFRFCQMRLMCLINSSLYVLLMGISISPTFTVYWNVSMC